MTTLSQYYKQKDANGTGITAKKTFNVPVDELYIVDGEQGRPLNMAHAEKMCELLIAGADLPALTVEVTEQGIHVLDGQHRYMGAVLATERGYQILRLECKDFVGTELQKLALQIGSNEGLQMTPVERAIQYNKAKNKGYSLTEIAREFHRSITDVENHLQLLSSGETLLNMVESGEVSATTAMELSKKHGPAAGRIAGEQLEKAKAAGKKKLTRTAALAQFSAKQSRLLVELLAKNCQAEQDEEDSCITLTFETDLQVAEVMDIIQAAREHFGVTISDSEQPPAPAEPENVEGDDLPLTKHEILEQSGVEVWACVQAAFKMKSQYTYAESKYAHTWAADSVEHPEHVVVPQDTIQTALRLIHMHQDEHVIKQWLSEQHDDPEMVAEQLLRFTGTLSDLRLSQPCTVQEFIELVEQTNRDCWSNYRMLRQAVHELAGMGVSTPAWPIEVNTVFSQIKSASDLSADEQRELKTNINRMLLEKMSHAEIIETVTQLPLSLEAGE
ncbi:MULTISPECIES: chromosome partitioning protein ParB [unclassified Pantoea]|uniref:chromosome partitioning protein ParB n=1 Tax=unclassified Pantoea TaxID=2630326 RepID=UPI002118E4B6|nr:MULTISPECIES: chromosome partitioning protein ParB [unclassified Pantoea]